MTIRVGPPPPPPPRPGWLVDNADRFRAAVEAARAEGVVAQRWYIPDTAHRDLFLAQDVALVCAAYMSKLDRAADPARESPTGSGREDLGFPPNDGSRRRGHA